jgi:hypothetical protein
MHVELIVSELYLASVQARRFGKFSSAASSFMKPGSAETLNDDLDDQNISAPPSLFGDKCNNFS